MKHEPPRYYGYYRNGFNKITQCKKCEIIGLYEDCHSVRPCKYCGGSVEDMDVAGKWVPPVYKGILFRKKIKDGYWLLGEDYKQKEENPFRYEPPNIDTPRIFNLEDYK
jgi:hypothetical protein